jgi:hypothetical protein
MKRKYLFRLFLFLGIVAAYWIINLFPCIVLRLSHFDKNTLLGSVSYGQHIAILNGTNLCSSCSAGTHLNSILKSHPGILVIVPTDFSENDIENLRNAYGITGAIINSGNELESILKKIAACVAKKGDSNNFVLEIADTGRIVRASVF